MGFVTRSLFYEFFSSGELRNTQKHWLNLKRRGLFKEHSSTMGHDVLVLNGHSESISNPEVAAIVSPPYVGQIPHDEAIGRIVLRARKQELIRRWFSEAELKKINAREFRLQGNHITAKYADALVQLNVAGAPVNVAIEVELSRKAFKRYEDVAYAYRSMENVKAVFFICKNLEIIEVIKSAFKMARFPSQEKPVGFALVSEWIVDPANADLELPTRRTTFGKLVGEIAEKRRQSQLSENTKV